MKEIIDYILEHFTIPHLIMLLILISLAIFLIVILVQSYHRRVHNLKKIISKKHNYSHLRIDLLNKTVYLFSTNNLKESQQIPLNDFINQYPEKDANSFNRWLFNQLNRKKTDSNYKEIINYNKKKKPYSKDLFMCTLVNVDRSTLHIDHYVSAYYHYLKADYEIDRCFFKLKKKSIVDIGLIKFFVLDEKSENKHLNPIQNRQLIDKLIKYANNKHLFTILKNGDIGLLIFNQKKGSASFLEKIKQEVNIFLSINDLTKFSFHISLVRNIGDKINFTECLKKANQVASYLLDNGQYLTEITYFDENKNYTCRNKSNKIDTIKRAIFKEEFIYNIVPFFYSKDAKVALHKFDLVPENQEISIEDVQECVYINKIENDYLDLFFNQLEKCYKPFEKNKVNQTILFSSPLYFINSILEKFNVKRKNYPFNFICSISNQDLEKEFDEEKLNILKNIKDSGIKLSIELNSAKKPRLEILELTDYILLDEEAIKNFADDNQISFLLTNLLSFFKKAKKAIIAFNINDWTTLETMICHYATIISANCLETKENQVCLGLDKKNINKIKDIYNKYY